MPTTPSTSSSANSGDRPERITRRCWLKAAGVAAIAALPGCASTLGAVHQRPPRLLIGYTEYRTNLPGGRYPNTITMRACVVRADGTRRRVLAEELVKKPHAWTQFAGWSPDGRLAIIGNGFETPENAAWEEEHQTFRFNNDWLYDMHLLDLRTGKGTNLTEIDRVSNYNTGLFFISGEPPRLGFQALIGGNSHPFTMDLNGRNKKDISAGAEGFAYGFSASPDGKLVAYHKDYQVYVADADGAHPRHIDTGNPFNFCPQWSPDGKCLMFVSGEHYNCHPYLVARDGSGLRKLADRGGYKGVVDVLDVPDFHNGSSDVPQWSPDSAWVYYSARVGDAVELMRVSLDARSEQLTHSSPNAFNYHPRISPDSHWVAFGSNRTGIRQLCVMPAESGSALPITRVPPGHGAMWASWQPRRN